jgi:hypothetical protein
MQIGAQQFFARTHDGGLVHVDAQPLFNTSFETVSASDTVNRQRGLPGIPALPKQDLSHVAEWQVTETVLEEYVASLHRQIKEEEDDERTRILWEKSLELAGLVIEVASWWIPPARIAKFIKIGLGVLKYTVSARQILWADNQLEATQEVGASLILSAYLNKSYEFLCLKGQPLETCTAAVTIKESGKTLSKATASEVTLWSCDLVKLGVQWSENRPRFVAPSTRELERAIEFRYHADPKYKSMVDGFWDMIHRFKEPPVINKAKVTASTAFGYQVTLSGTKLGMLEDVLLGDSHGSWESVAAVPSNLDEKAEIQVPYKMAGQRRIVAFSRAGGFSNEYPLAIG